MCDPLVAASAASAGVSAIGAYNQSRAARDAYRYQSRVASNNQAVANYQADDAIHRGDQAVLDHNRKTSQLKGAQRASLAARGLDLQFGSALDILTETDYLGAQDAATIKHNAEREAWAIRQQVANFGAEANLLKSRADAENPFMAGVTSLIGSSGQVAGQWYRHNRAGG